MLWSVGLLLVQSYRQACVTGLESVDAGTLLRQGVMRSESCLEKVHTRGGGGHRLTHGRVVVIIKPQTDWTALA